MCFSICVRVCLYFFMCVSENVWHAKFDWLAFQVVSRRFVCVTVSVRRCVCLLGVNWLAVKIWQQE